MGDFAAAITAIDEANNADPNVMVYGGVEWPKELLHSEMLSNWVSLLSGGEPSELLLLAARAQHIRRWEVPRHTYPEGRSGYLRWRTGLHDFHANIAAEILQEAGYEDGAVVRVTGLIRKRGLGKDPEMQVLEDGLCLVFLETQFDELAGRTPDEKLQNIIRRTWNKMSPSGQAAALNLVTPSQRAVIEAALAAPSTS